ncbi:hypothetical protein F5148DRAFT_1148880 [Russula earlei]|uniref:Uncharacterized protein n=1 Tax=Russula earlei TaxID=71964 RepID=A0ACC0UAI5_9AGAM|nr:hypothetical protein F5148DRAFT_1148880 [Russula earlei]
MITLRISHAAMPGSSDARANLEARRFDYAMFLGLLYPSQLRQSTGQWGGQTISDIRASLATCCFTSRNRELTWEFHPCDSGFTIKNVSSGTFLVLEDLQGLHAETSVEVVTVDFPTYWEMEVMDNGSTEDGEKARMCMHGDDVAFPDQGRERDEHVLATARATAQAGHEVSTPLEHRNCPARWGDDLDNDHERDDNDENHNAGCYGQRPMLRKPSRTGRHERITTHHVSRFIYNMFPEELMARKKKTILIFVSWPVGY